MEYKNFSSLPPADEKHFAIYEKTSIEAGKKSILTGIAVGAILAVFALVIYFGVSVPEKHHDEKHASSDLQEEAVPEKAPAKHKE